LGNAAQKLRSHPKSLGIQESSAALHGSEHQLGKQSLVTFFFADMQVARARIPVIKVH